MAGLVLIKLLTCRSEKGEMFAGPGESDRRITYNDQHLIVEEASSPPSALAGPKVLGSRHRSWSAGAACPGRLLDDMRVCRE